MVVSGAIFNNMASHFPISRNGFMIRAPHKNAVRMRVKAQIIHSGYLWATKYIWCFPAFTLAAGDDAGKALQTGATLYSFTPQFRANRWVQKLKLYSTRSRSREVTRVSDSVVESNNSGTINISDINVATVTGDGEDYDNEYGTLISTVHLERVPPLDGSATEYSLAWNPFAYSCTDIWGGERDYGTSVNVDSDSAYQAQRINLGNGARDYLFGYELSDPIDLSAKLSTLLADLSSLDWSQATASQAWTYAEFSTLRRGCPWNQAVATGVFTQLQLPEGATADYWTGISANVPLYKGAPVWNSAWHAAFGFNTEPAGGAGGLDFFILVAFRKFAQHASENTEYFFVAEAKFGEKLNADGSLNPDGQWEYRLLSTGNVLESLQTLGPGLGADVDLPGPATTLPISPLSTGCPASAIYHVAVIGQSPSAWAAANGVSFV